MEAFLKVINIIYQCKQEAILRDWFMQIPTNLYIINQSVQMHAV